MHGQPHISKVQVFPSTYFRFISHIPSQDQTQHHLPILKHGDRCSTVVKVLRYKIGSSLVRSLLISLEFFSDIKSFRSHYGPGVDSAFNRNEYQEHFLGGKGGRCLRLINLPPSRAVVMKSGDLNFLDFSGPVQACNGTDLHFFLKIIFGGDFLKFV